MVKPSGGREVAAKASLVAERSATMRHASVPAHLAQRQGPAG
jgi:hypothetical protein